MIRVTMAVFGSNPHTLEKAISQAKQIGDEVVVVYGRWKGFDLPWVDPPDFLVDDPDVKLIISDHKYVQRHQRNLYLYDLKDGDVLMYWDSDETMSDVADAVILMNILKNTDDWDSVLLVVKKPDLSYEQSSIRIWNFKKGWTHSKGQILQDVDNVMIAGPYYKVLKVDAKDLYIIHHRDKVPGYRGMQRKYWDGLS